MWARGGQGQGQGQAKGNRKGEINGVCGKFEGGKGNFVGAKWKP